MRVSAVITVAVLGAAINLASQATVAREVYYTSGNNGAAIFAIIVQGNKVTTKTVGSPGVPGCGSLAMSKWGTLYAGCGDLFGVQQLATIDIHTGHATMFGAPTAGLAVMTITFGPDGTLYAVGDCNPDFSVPECKPGKDPNFNSLYTIDVSTGAFSRVGATGAPQYFMDLAFDRHGHLFGVTTTLAPTYIPAILYQIDPSTGAATKVVDLVGSSQVMGLAFGHDGRLYATDYMNNAGLYLIDPKTGFETAIAALPFGYTSNLELVSADDE